MDHIDSKAELALGRGHALSWIDWFACPTGSRRLAVLCARCAVVGTEGELLTPAKAKRVTKRIETDPYHFEWRP